MFTRFIVILLSVLVITSLTTYDAVAVTADAGPDTTLNLTPSVSAVHLDGSNSTDDGTITEYKWWDGAIYSAHVPMGFSPAEWNEVNSTPFPRP
jgi:hypothetical protein